MKGLAPQTSAIFDSIIKMECIKPFVLVGSTAYARYDFNYTVLFLSITCFRYQSLLIIIYRRILYKVTFFVCKDKQCYSENNTSTYFFVKKHIFRQKTMRLTAHRISDFLRENVTLMSLTGIGVFSISII